MNSPRTAKKQVPWPVYQVNENTKGATAVYQAPPARDPLPLPHTHTHPPHPLRCARRDGAAPAHGGALPPQVPNELKGSQPVYQARPLPRRAASCASRCRTARPSAHEVLAAAASCPRPLPLAAAPRALLLRGKVLRRLPAAGGRRAQPRRRARDMSGGAVETIEAAVYLGG